ncbi:MAG: hypothetical protein O7D30_10850 [Rickettsia endosymbiont of Ixodes persulcatus]|nr:hypothetical protein [Rickettsia endosymbiont of Ixodes persulcatus]
MKLLIYNDHGASNFEKLPLLTMHELIYFNHTKVILYLRNSSVTDK